MPAPARACEAYIGNPHATRRTTVVLALPDNRPCVPLCLRIRHEHVAAPHFPACRHGPDLRPAAPDESEARGPYRFPSANARNRPAAMSAPEMPFSYLLRRGI